MFNMKKILCLLLAALFLTGCGGNTAPESTAVPTETGATAEAPLGIAADYAVAVQPDMASDTAKQEVTVKQFVDGDTVHFHVPESVMPDGVLKARFLAINTPESTGKIEEYGKAASNFTKEKLSAATEILIESETDTWNADSTGDRYLVWVWYKAEGADEYRNLNIEILQNGLAIANNASQNQYGEVCTAAIAYARAQKLNIHSGQKDPDFYYGEAVELTIKELRSNIEAYAGMKVAFNGIITVNDSNTVYVEDFDPETGLYYGMTVYYGFGMNGAALEILTVGNEVRIVGSVQYYEGGGTWQVSDLNYRMMQPDDPGNIQKLSEGHAPAFTLTDPDTFVNGEVTVESDDSSVTAPYAQLALSTSLRMENLVVKQVYTTTDTESSSKGAMTLSCEVDGIPVTVRTAVLLDENGELITADAFLGRTIDVKGIVEYFNGNYQIKVFSAKNITVHE